MSPLKPRDLERTLQRKFGFEQAPNKSDDHRWYKLSLEGIPPILTKVSRSNKDIGSTLESKIAHQLHVKPPFFRKMFSCTKDLEAYRRQLLTDPYPPFESSN